MSLTTLRTMIENDNLIPDNVTQQAESLIFFLALPLQRQRYGEDTVAAIQARLGQLIYSSTPEEAKGELWDEICAVKKMLGGWR